MATNQYLPRVRVTVVGTDIVGFTDESGTYRLTDVPSGSATLTFFYTGLDEQRSTLAVASAGRIEHDVALTSATRYGAGGEIVKADPFVVLAEREANAQAVATNEQRFASNIKTVVATDSFGDVLGGSVGEFLKFLPGVSVMYSGNEITDVTVRGIGAGMTAFTTDGAPMVFATYAPPTRGFNTYTQDINDASRIEVTKVPTPSTPADSIGGSINLVSKSAFDRDRPLFRWGVSVVGNSKHMTLGKVPVSFGDEKSHAVYPGYNFDYTLPLSKRLGIVVTGLHIKKTGDNFEGRTAFATTGAGTNATESSPYLKQYLELSGPRALTRSNLSFKVDWKATKNSVLSAALKWSQNASIIGAHYRQYDVGAVGTPLNAGGIPLTFGPDFTSGAAGRGILNMVSAFQRFGGGTVAPTANYRFDNGDWKVEASASYARSKMSKDNREGGPFQGLTAVLNVTSPRIGFLDFSPGNAGRIEVRDAANTIVDLNDIRNFRIATAQEIFYDRADKVWYGEAKVRRRLHILPVPAAIEVGGSSLTKNHNGIEFVRNLTFNGPDGNAATIESAEPYRMQTFTDRGIPWLSPDQAWVAAKNNPALITQTPLQMVQQENTRRNGSKYIEEQVLAGYVQAETSLLNNRLKVLTGVRYEETTDEGRGVAFDPGAVWVRNANGTFARNAQGARIRRADAGAVNSMEQLNLTTVERGHTASRTYDNYHPSLHLTYNVRENLVARAAYAKTIGRPDYAEILPTATINEADLNETQLGNPAISPGAITVNNTGLKPWTAHNYDLSLEFYSASGGLVSAGVFLKEISNFFGDQQRIATLEDLEALGLDPQYVGWMLNSKFNSGDARISGLELNLRQSLRNLGGWGRYFTVFANGTKLRLEGNRRASFDTFIPESGNAGFTFARNRFGFAAKVNHRGRVHLRVVAGESGTGILPAFGGSPQAHGRPAKPFYTSPTDTQVGKIGLG